MDLLSCPMCRRFPLKLHVFSVEARYSVNNPIQCELYCSFHGGMVRDLEETKCMECYTYEIVEGILTCPGCGRWYGIIDEIPVMLPDELRDRKRDRDFLAKWADKIPPEISRSESSV